MGKSISPFVQISKDFINPLSKEVTILVTFTPMKLLKFL
jgi:hypothetical protein